MLMVWLVVLILTLCLLNLSRRRHPNFPPGPPRLPIWGSYWFLLKEDYHQAYKAVHKLAQKYKTDLLGFYLGDNPCVFVTGYKTCKDILTREEFNGRLDGFIFKKRSFGDIFGVFFKDGHFWKEQRRFTLRHLRDYGFGRRFSESEKAFQNEVAEVLHLCDNVSKNEKILLPNVFYAPVLNCMLYISVGRKFENRLMEEMSVNVMKYVDSFNATGCAISITPWIRHFAPKFFHAKEIFEQNRDFYDFFAMEVNDRKLFSSESYSDFLSTYLNKIQTDFKNNVTNSNFTENQLIWVLIDYMFPVPAIPHLLSYVWAYLLMHPNVEDNIVKEIDKVVGRNRLPNLDDRSKMPYTEAVIKETLRKHPLITLITPRRCTEDTTVNGYFIPKNTAVIPCLWSINNDPLMWDKPELFRPERFLDENQNLLRKDCTINFGGGKRVCPGETFSRQVVFLFLTGILQKFHFKSVGKIPNPNNDKGAFVVYMEEFWVEPVPR